MDPWLFRTTAGRFQKFASFPAGAGLNGMADEVSSGLVPTTWSGGSTELRDSLTLSGRPGRWAFKVNASE